MRSKKVWKLTYLSPGERIRLGRIIKGDGRTLIVAMDHGSFAGPIKGIENPAETIEKIKKGGADAVILTPGIAEKVVDVVSGDLGLILRINGSATIVSRPYLEDVEFFPIASVKDAVTLGADAVITMFYIGSRREADSLHQLSMIARECDEYGVPLVAEVFPVEPGGKNPRDPKVLSIGIRVAVEAGADMIKTHYTGDKESFRSLIETVNVPIVILGGPKRESIKEVLKDVRDAMDAGAVGIAFGRNIWQAKDPEKMTRALSKIIHENAGVEEALEIIGEI